MIGSVAAEQTLVATLLGATPLDRRRAGNAASSGTTIGRDDERSARSRAALTACSSLLQPQHLEANHPDKAAHRSTDFPVVRPSVNTPLVSTVKITRPMKSVVEGPAGTSVGKRINTL